MSLTLFAGDLCLSLFWYALFCVLSSFAMILKRKRDLVALLLLSYRCLVIVYVLGLFLMVPWVGLQSRFEVFLNILTFFYKPLIFKCCSCKKKGCKFKILDFQKLSSCIIKDIYIYTLTQIDDTIYTLIGA